jgi:NDP-sugar pyrophosphorylase family protein
MVLWSNPELQVFYSKVGVDAAGHLCSLPRSTIREPVRTGIFTGIHILENAAFPYLKEVPSGINEVLYPALMKERPDRLYGHFMEGNYWYDTGELKYFWSTSVHLLESLHRGDPVLRDFLQRFGKYEEKIPGVWGPSDTDLPTNVAFHPPAIVGRRSRFGRNVIVGPYAVIGDDVAVGDEAQLSRLVVLGPSQIPDGRVSANALQFEQLVVPMEPSR